MLSLPLEPEPNQSVLGKLGLGPPERDFVAARNAAVKGDWATFQIVCGQDGFQLLRAYEERWKTLLVQAVAEFAANAQIDAHERDWLKRVATGLSIPPSLMEAAVREGIREAFKRSATRAVADGSVSDEEEARLRRLAAKLQISDDEFTSIYGAAAAAVFQSEADGVMADGLVSPEEEQRLNALLVSLKLNITNSVEFRNALNHGRKRWEIVHGALPEIATDLNLGNGETAHFNGTGDWYELRTVRDHVNYAGLRGRVRIMKGLSFAYGSIRYAVPSREQMQQIDSGQIVMTNKRLLFMGAKGNKSLRWSEVLAVNVTSHNTFELEKTRGRNPVIDIRSASYGCALLAPSIVQRLVDGDIDGSAGGARGV